MENQKPYNIDTVILFFKENYEKFLTIYNSLNEEVQLLEYKAITDSLNIELLRSISEYYKKIVIANNIHSSCDDALVLVELMEIDDVYTADVLKIYDTIKGYINQYLQLTTFSDKISICGCVVSIASGAGGVEAEDWTGMLSRMYMRWSIKELKHTPNIIDITHSLEANEGIKNITFIIDAEYAYGKLKNETGVHRLIRKSPFSKSSARHTSFASVNIVPLIEENKIEIILNKSDLRIEAMRGHGAGGQNRNKLETAIRITHIPTGIQAYSQSERSQLINKENAMRVLISRLYELEEKKREEGRIKTNTLVNSFGSQIRTYVLHPTQYIKDHRNKYIEYDFNKVLDGDLNNFILKNLVK